MNIRLTPTKCIFSTGIKKETVTLRQTRVAAWGNAGVLGVFAQFSGPAGVSSGKKTT